MTTTASTETEFVTDTAAADVIARPSVRVVEAVADAIDADPLELPPLYETVDPDALDALFDAGLEGCVQFPYDGHDVTIHGDGTLVVDGEEVAR